MERGKKYVIVIQDLFTKWPLIFTVLDQKASRIARLLAEEVVPLFGVPEALLSDRGTNLLSQLVIDLCEMLGITKLNTTAYHPQCDGAVERFNRTLKMMLQKHAASFGKQKQWDQYLPGLLWAYRNTPHTFTGEEILFLLFGIDCRSTIESSYLPTSKISQTDVSDYCQELMHSLSLARELAAGRIQSVQAKYKEHYYRGACEVEYWMGDWVLIRFPQEESGPQRKLSRPWHGSYRIIGIQNPNATVL